MEDCKSEYAEATAVFISPQSTNEVNKTLTMFPNPAISSVSITSAHKIDLIRVFDISSRIFIQQAPNINNAVLDISKLSKGLYTAEIVTGKNSFIRKLIVQ